MGVLESEGDRQPEHLQHVELKYVTNDECNADYSPTLITDNMMCAKDPGQDSCQGDSGGKSTCYSISFVFFEIHLDDDL